jgi:hypothetical protein
MVSSYLALAVFGAAILQGSSVERVVGWVSAVVGLLGAVVYVVRVPHRLWMLFDLPGVVYLVTGSIGVGLLLRD